jgi:hypothetical protein
MPMSNEASELRPGALRPSGDEFLLLVAGLCETQSCTSSETFGFAVRLTVLREAGFEVMTITGPEGICDEAWSKGCEAR